MTSIQHHSKSRYSRRKPHYYRPLFHRWPFLRCCPFYEHEALLADLELDAQDPDIAALLPSARRLLTGSGGQR